VLFDLGRAHVVVLQRCVVARRSREAERSAERRHPKAAARRLQSGGVCADLAAERVG
jgi:hypothetical protein